MSKQRQIEIRLLNQNDIEDAIHWFLDETEWKDWDAPWEKDDPFDEISYRNKKLKLIQDRNPYALQPRMEIYLDDIHMGWVSSYKMNQNYEYDEEGKDIAIGIVIVDPKYRNQGYGKKALKLYLELIWNFGFTKVFMQTWSGNTPMIQSAKSLGFVECHRKPNLRLVKEKLYDGLTFVIEK